MGIWLREFAGWVLLAIGLTAFAACYVVFLLQQRIIEAAIMAFVAWVIFRAGMHLLKLAMASRAARDLVKPTIAATKPVPVTRLQPSGPAPGRARESVVPGQRS